jgi:hypothetical protein
MPKFTFPVPGRRRNPPPVSVGSAPTSKAHRILGTGEINIDSPTLPKDQARHWDSRPVSGISISVSESAVSWEDHDGLAGMQRQDEREPASVADDEPLEVESGVLPGWTGGGRTPRDNVTGLRGMDGGVQSPTDSSSMRRRLSNSTILSYYDKTKVPLHISQQTSNSAMAKGLPRKASSLLDVDGSRSTIRSTKKKPARLDLSMLLPKGRSPRTSKSQKSLVLGPDMMTSSPSYLSPTPAEAGHSPNATQAGRVRSVIRKATREFMQGDTATSPSKLVKSNKQDKSVQGLQNLYDHYEQMSFRDALVDEVATPELASPAESPSALSPPVSQSSNDLLSPFGNHTRRLPFTGSSSLSNIHEATTPVTAIPSGSALLSPPGDCGASISSRHTRTSKASRRTSISVGDRDLHLNSVLSLSSDSEGDDVEQQPKAAPGSAKRLNTLKEMPTKQETRIRIAPRSPSAPVVVVKPSPIRISPPQIKTQHLTVPSTTTTPIYVTPPKINPRTSSLSLSSSRGTAKKSHQRSGSRVSVLTTSTMTSIASALESSPPQTTPPGIREARAITMIPAQVASRQTGNSPHRTFGSDQPTPPLSPTSVEFYLRSQHASVADLDQGSLKSFKSFGTNGSGRENLLAGDGRYMAVTRQEEQLLAALRKKRAHMREAIMAELEDEQDKSDSLTHLSVSDGRPSQRSSVVSSVAELLQHPTPQVRKSVVSTKEPRSRLPEAPVSAFRSRYPEHITEEPADDSPKDDNFQAQAVSFLRPSSEEVPGEDIDGGEPSPDLSDFMDFDDGVSSDSFPSQAADDTLPLPPHAGKYNVPARTSSVERRGRTRTAAPRDSNASEGLATAYAPRKLPLRSDDVQVRILDDPVEMNGGDSDAGIPRPDSPVDAPLALSMQSDSPPVPRKKAVRISAVGRVGMEVGWWGDDG